MSAPNARDMQNKILKKLLTTAEQIADDVVSGDGIPVQATFVSPANQNVTITSPTVFPVNDNGGSLTVDGTITANAGTGVFHVDDNAGSLTVDGSVSVSNFPATQPVSGTVTANAGSGPFPVSDNAGSLTVDAPVGTPVFVRLSDGTAAITTLPVSIATSLSVKPYTPITTDIISGSATVTNSTTAVAIITIPANRTWFGTVTASGGWTSTTGAASATIIDILTAGTNVSPAVGTRVASLSVSNLVGSGQSLSMNNVYVTAPVGNSVTLTVKNSTATTFQSTGSATGYLL